MISTVAVGTDGSATAEQGCHRGGRDRPTVRGQARAAERLPGLRRLAPGPESGHRAQWASSSSARVRSILERSEEDLSRSGIECETRVDEGDPAAVLVRLAECGADLLVLGNKG